MTQFKSIFEFQQAHYDIIWNPSTRKAYFVCKHCGLKRKTEDAIYRHIIRKHYHGDVQKAWKKEVK